MENNADILQYNIYRIVYNTFILRQLKSHLRPSELDGFQPGSVSSESLPWNREHKHTSTHIDGGGVNNSSLYNTHRESGKKRREQRLEVPVPSQVAHIVELAMIYKVSLDAFVRF